MIKNRGRSATLTLFVPYFVITITHLIIPSSCSVPVPEQPLSTTIMGGTGITENIKAVDEVVTDTVQEVNNKTTEFDDEDDYEDESLLDSPTNQHNDSRIFFLFTVSHNPDDVKFFLYRDFNNPNRSEELFLNDTQSITNSSFKPKKKTIFVIHGFWSNRTTGMPTTIKQGLMDAGLPHNIILVDWGKLSSPDPKNDNYFPLSYPIIVKKNIPIVYQRIGEFVQFLIDNNFTTLKKLHIIGHSLGAHVSGGVGSVVAGYSQNNGRKIARISGLDPAGPLFDNIQVQKRITYKDAHFVDIYHTAAGTLGSTNYDEGHVNFLPNGGHHQPGCVDKTEPMWEDQGGSCSHAFVYKIYAASFLRNFTACFCDPKFFDYVLGTNCPGDCSVTVLAGYSCPSDARGQFYFKTGEDPFVEDDEDLMT